MNPEMLLCPATQSPCPNKQYMGSLIEGASYAQMCLEFEASPEGITPESEAALQQKIIEDYNIRKAAIERDSRSSCNGTVCGPLARMASRFLFEGPSITEVKQQ
ncbi:MAG TPA: hypothetical protein VLF43_04670 [Candidatus Saccharimonadales bacterium]|nr:hypothetical protein [Candidatus Saccharimonadales bacterium]